MSSTDHAIAGATASILSMSLLYPLDQLRTILQIRKEYSDRIDFKLNLYKGFLPTIECTGVSFFLYFLFLNFFKRRISIGSKNTHIILSSTIAGVLNVIATNPLWIRCMKAKTENSVNSKSPMISLFYDLYSTSRNQGKSRIPLYEGLVPSLVLVTNPIIQFSTYELLSRENSSNFQSFLNGAIAKFIATLVTYPVQVAQSRLRSANSGEFHIETHRKNPYKYGYISLVMEDMFLPIYELFLELKALYIEGKMFAGFRAKLLQTVLNSAFMFMFYERLFSLVVFIRKSKRN